MAEIQVSTLLSSIVADIDHNTLYKQHIKTTDSQKELIESLRRHATIKEAEKLQK
jgi:ppGpp synthetase/RelA/SpoT-type nucleotidyltranferase